MGTQSAAAVAPSVPVFIKKDIDDNTGMSFDHRSKTRKLSMFKSFRKKKQNIEEPFISKQVSQPIVIGDSFDRTTMMEEQQQQDQEQEQQNGKSQPIHQNGDGEYENGDNKNPTSSHVVTPVSARHNNNRNADSTSSTTLSLVQLHQARNEANRLEHTSNNLKEALRQVLSSKRHVEEENERILQDLSSYKEINMKLRKRLEEEQKISGSLGLADVYSLQKQRDLLESEINQGRQKSREDALKLRQIREELESCQEKNEKLAIEVSKVEAERSILQSTVDKTEKLCEDSLLQVEKMQEELMKVKAEKLEKTQRIIFLQDELSDAQSSVIATKTEKDRICSKLLKLESKHNEAKESEVETRYEVLRNEFEALKLRSKENSNRDQIKIKGLEEDLSEYKRNALLTKDKHDHIVMKNHELLLQAENASEEIATLKISHNLIKQELEKLKGANHELKVKMNRQATVVAGAGAEIQNFRRELQKVKSDYQKCKEDLALKEKELERERTNVWTLREVQSENDATIAQLQATRDTVAHLKLQLDDREKRHKVEVDSLRSKVEYLNKVSQFETSKNYEKHEMAIVLAKLDIQTQDMQDLRAQLTEHENIRVQMLNTIQELRGNIRTFVRVRPFLSIEKDENSAFEVNENENEIRAFNKINGECVSFKFDRVFSCSTSQEEMFANIVDYVQSALDGYSVCLFSYGPTGTGKTFTMHGIGDGEMRGLVPRAIEYICTYIDTVSNSSRWDISLSASYLEIYNEDIYDLLLDIGNSQEKAKPNNVDTSIDTSDMTSDDVSSSSGEIKLSTAEKKSPARKVRNSKIPGVSNTSLSRAAATGRTSSTRNRFAHSPSNKVKTTPKNRTKASTSTGGFSKKKALALKRDSNGKIYVDGLTKVNIDYKNFETDMGIITECASKSRSVGRTKCNNKSSRSHAIFVIETKLTCKSSGQTRTGCLHFCDLAGNEKFENISRGAQTKELQAINKSLSCLGDVFHALRVSSAHVPFRNSKLTYLLQDCLSGDGKAVMIGNVSPVCVSSYETVTTLRFVQNVNKIELGRATKNISVKTP